MTNVRLKNFKSLLSRETLVRQCFETFSNGIYKTGYLPFHIYKGV